MRRRTKVAVALITAIVAFIFLVPIAQMWFAYPWHPCSPSAMVCDGPAYLGGHASVTFWLFGVGATSGSVDDSGSYNPGYGLAIGTCSMFTYQTANGNTTLRACSISHSI